MVMVWEVEYTDEFGIWYESELCEEEQDSVAAVVDLLVQDGPHLGYPHTSSIQSSRHSRMRELRIQHQGEPYRVLYAFDPRRTAVLLLGGCKTGNDSWYEQFVPKADNLYAEHLDELGQEGLI